MVRDAIARTAGTRYVPGEYQVRARYVPGTYLVPGPDGLGEPGRAAFALLPLARGGDGDGACLIEPTVRCNHCGYCQSYGH